MSIDIAELRRLAEAATQAPWRPIIDRSNRPVVICDGTINVADCWHMPNLSGDGRANAQLIAAMRNALPSLLDELEGLRKDAERYRWLHNQHWSTSTLCVVTNPRSSVKLGHECPSGDLLDQKIDAAIRAEGKGDE